MWYRIFATLILMSFLSFTLSAQQNYNLIKEGTKLLEQKKFGEAEAAFKKVIQNDNTIKEAHYNLGSAVYGQGRFEEARASYSKALPMFEDKKNIAETHYNIGNTFMSEKKWEESIKSFKNALKNNPADTDSKYNLAYAQEMLKKQQQDQEQNKDKKNEPDEDKKEDKKDDKKNEDKKDGDKDKKDEEKKQDDKKDGDQDKEDQKKDENKPPKENPANPNKLSKEETERMLNAIESQEQKLQDKKRQEEMSPVRIKTDKDW